MSNINNSIYNNIITTKNNSQIPMLLNGKTIESRYNPQEGAKKILSSIGSDTGFVILLGLSSGIVANTILQSNPNLNLIVFEISQDDFSFLHNLDNIKILEKNPRVTFSTIDNLHENILSHYLPSKQGNLQVIEQQPWNEINLSQLPVIKQIIQNSINIVASDYSVQAHFGKIWTHNIINNFFLNTTKLNKFPQINTLKTAAIIAAGPSLDQTVSKLKSNRDDYIIFSTDTALQSLLKLSVIPDFVVSIDGQNVSYNHFFSIPQQINFIFDLCGNSSAAKKAAETNNVYFFASGHPLSNLLNSNTNNLFPQIYNGSGTVTIAALDIALKTGFKKIEVFGADFGFVNNKPYTQGTYLDSLYNIKSSRIHTNENQYDSLMFRTEIFKVSDSKVTTKILASYEESLISYLKKMNCEFIHHDNIYDIRVNHLIEKIHFKKAYYDASKILFEICKMNMEELMPALLPYIAFLRKLDKNSKKFDEYCKLAQSFIVSYNKIYEK